MGLSVSKLMQFNDTDGGKEYVIFPLRDFQLCFYFSGATV